jgi:hypothetical protein
MGDDFCLYYARSGDEGPTDGPFRFGPKVDLVEAPFDWSLDDWPYLGLNWQAHHVGLRTPSEVFEVWKAEFDYCASLPGERVFTLTMHPQIMGRGSRLAMLERLIEHMLATPDVRFSTLLDATRAFRATSPFSAEAAPGAPTES